MVSGAPKPWTIEDFLDWERVQPDRYEFSRGVIRMMTGGSNDHTTIKGNTFVLLRDALAGGSCRVFVDGPKVLTEAGAFYPDVVVTCQPIRGKDDFIGQPSLIVEVLSRTTEHIDRGEKWVAYQELESLRHYVLVSQDEPRADLYTRRGRAWDYTVFAGIEAIVELEAFDAHLPLGAVYTGSTAGSGA